MLDADAQRAVRDVGTEWERREPQLLLEAVAAVKRPAARCARDRLLRAVRRGGKRVLVGPRAGRAPTTSKVFALTRPTVSRTGSPASVRFCDVL
ncbi:MAG: hypothetical protein ACLGHP_11885, partial [Vicinamibacteria bacterium]